MTTDAQAPAHAKPPRQVFETVFAFPPNRDTLGGTAYLIQDRDQDGDPANILVDAPAWNDGTRDFLADLGGVRWLFISHRANLGKAAAIQKALSCEVVIQEQEAYLLPATPNTSFQQDFRFTPRSQALWTPGYSPGSACLYHSAYGGILFTGRHLLPNRDGNPEPLRFSKTFHWPRQLRQVERLQSQFSADTLAHICPGANTGFLRGKLTVFKAYDHLSRLDIEAYRTAKPVL